ncbi:MAG: thioredoxin family protein [Clostridiales bacterium]|jgi:thioredoxin-related protein|nr:thioredoxin family protein [Clostridiales bacterium]
MKVVILGRGCYNCQALEKEVFNALSELDIAAELNSISDPALIDTFNVPGVPALIINGNTKVYGRVPGKEEIKKWLIAEK